MAHRNQLMHDWLGSLGICDYSLTPVSGDASFRAYHRLRQSGHSWIVMDAPPQHECCDSFITLAQKLRAAQLNAPEIIAENRSQGFLLLSDLGDDTYLSQLNDTTQAQLYADALAALVQMQSQLQCDALAPYDAALLEQEMDWFRDWFLRALLGIELTASQQSTWLKVKQQLINNAIEQPQVFVHRDFHSRNLMKTNSHHPGILDFQDAVKGPVSYDLVSLLRDCYIRWPAAQVAQQVADYHQLARKHQLMDAELEQFMHWFNLMGVQRHLKCVGIFSRLKVRDAKPDYLKNIPRIFDYLHQVSITDRTLSQFEKFLSGLNLSQRVKKLL